jgi:hypothetical protein
MLQENCVSKKVTKKKKKMQMNPHNTPTNLRFNEM